MIALIWQTALLLLGAYFLGAFLACLVRRSLYALAPKRPQPAAAPPGPSEATTRFERALTGEGSAMPAAAGAADTERTAALLAAARSVGAVARRSPPRPAAPDNAGTAAALTAAAAAAGRREVRPHEAGLSLALPVPANTTGQSAVRADVRVPSPRAQVPSVAAAADDLTCIRGIDGELAARLNALGVRRYADIAAWRAEEVERIGTKLGLRKRIARDNWIEQAQILASGGETFYLRSRTGAVPYPAGPSTAPPSVPPTMAAATAAAAAAAASRVGDDLRRIAGIDAAIEGRLNAEGITSYRQIAVWTADDVAHFGRLLGGDGRIAGECWVEQAQILSRGGETAFSRAFDRLGGALPGEAPAPEAGAPAAGGDADRQSRSGISGLRSVRSEAYLGAEGELADGAAGGGDDLKRIRGIGVLIERRLNAMGITRYEQIAQWTAEDVERVSGKLEFKGRIERENWIEQARILASGGQTEFSRRIDRGEVEKRG